MRQLFIGKKSLKKTLYLHSDSELLFLVRGNILHIDVVKRHVVLIWFYKFYKYVLLHN